MMTNDLDMHQDRRDYLSYLLRIWRVSQAGGTGEKTKAVWRASLESPQTGERKGFRGLEALFGFLNEQIDLLDGTSADDAHYQTQTDKTDQGP